MVGSVAAKVPGKTTAGSLRYGDGWCASRYEPRAPGDSPRRTTPTGEESGRGPSVGRQGRRGTGDPQRPCQSGEVRRPAEGGAVNAATPAAKSAEP
ncbi:hypothetical protein GCM10009737_15040 [Nocardioides lentus]|uniref:Uncharacterized protein n=1 Tax=Nocardioides lentus TaxID=338077 RepID=A0ABP5AHZ2_9ACTN